MNQIFIEDTLIVEECNSESKTVHKWGDNCMTEVVNKEVKTFLNQKGLDFDKLGSKQGQTKTLKVGKIECICCTISLEENILLNYFEEKKYKSKVPPLSEKVEKHSNQIKQLEQLKARKDLKSGERKK